MIRRLFNQLFKATNGSISVSEQQAGVHKTCYSQTGEDVIMDFLCQALGLNTPSFIDIGAFHPINLNNTYLFYRQGATGISIEPNSSVLEEFKRVRGRDQNLNIAVAAKSGSATYFEFDSPALNTMSKIEADEYVRLGHRLQRTVTVPVETIDSILLRCGYARFPTILSLDVEGLELEILQSIDFEVNGPSIICLETLAYHPTLGHGKKRTDLIDFVAAKNYEVYADTYINTIFVRSNLLNLTHPIRI